MRARLLCLAVVFGAASLVPAASWACDSTGCLLLTRGQNGVMAKGTWRVDLSVRNTDDSDPRRGSDPASLVLRPKIYFEQERVIPAYHLDRKDTQALWAYLAQRDSASSTNREVR